VGTGAQRGWYISAGSGRGLSAGSFTAAKLQHNISMGTWYKDGGKSRDATQDRPEPDPNFFASGTAGDPTTFIPGAQGRPRGDRKLFSEENATAAFEVPTYETAWAKGYAAPNTLTGTPTAASVRSAWTWARRSPSTGRIRRVPAPGRPQRDQCGALGVREQFQRA